MEQRGRIRGAHGRLLIIPHVTLTGTDGIHVVELLATSLAILVQSIDSKDLGIYSTYKYLFLPII